MAKKKTTRTKRAAAVVPHVYREINRRKAIGLIHLGIHDFFVTASPVHPHDNDGADLIKVHGQPFLNKARKYAKSQDADFLCWGGDSTTAMQMLQTYYGNQLGCGYGDLKFYMLDEPAMRKIEEYARR